MDWRALVGRPYAFPADPPATFDCWQLTRWVREQQGRASPLPFSDREAWCVPGNLAEATRRARGLWVVLPGPAEWAMAVLEPAHVGVVVEGGVLHALARNCTVVWSTMAVIRRRWPRAEFWEAAA